MREIVRTKTPRDKAPEPFTRAPRFVCFCALREDNNADCERVYRSTFKPASVYVSETSQAMRGNEDI